MLPSMELEAGQDTAVPGSWEPRWEERSGLERFRNTGGFGCGSQVVTEKARMAPEFCTNGKDP